MAFLTEETGRTVTNTAFPVTADYSIKQFGTSSGSFNGTSNYLTIDGSDGQLSFGTSVDFTIECWVRSSILYLVPPVNGSIARGLLEFRNGSTSILRICYIGRNYFGQFNGLIVSSPNANTTVPVLQQITSGMNNTWVHIAICRDVTSLRSYVNGANPITYSNLDIASITSLLVGYSDITGNSVISGNNRALNISGTGSSYYSGNIDEFRVVKGKALYTGSSFTPPTNPFTL